MIYYCSFVQVLYSVLTVTYDLIPKAIDESTETVMPWGEGNIVIA